MLQTNFSLDFIAYCAMYAVILFGLVLIMVASLVVKDNVTKWGIYIFSISVVISVVSTSIHLNRLSSANRYYNRVSADVDKKMKLQAKVMGAMYDLLILNSSIRLDCKYNGMPTKRKSNRNVIQRFKANSKIWEVSTPVYITFNKKIDSSIQAFINFDSKYQNLCAKGVPPESVWNKKVSDIADKLSDRVGKDWKILTS